MKDEGGRMKLEFAIIKKIAAKRPSSSLIPHPSSFATLFLAALCFTTGCSRQPSNEVVIYCSVDQVHAEPILKEFEKQTSIRVKAVYDSEAVKSVGLVNRLRVEAKNPQADIFWNNEIAGTYQLYWQNIVDKPRLFAARARVLVFNSKMVKADDAPHSIFDLTAPKWRGKVAMAYPLFGTTSTHAAALFAALGAKSAETYYLALKENDVQLFEGNSVACEQVARGQCLVGITDTDDFWERKSSGLPIEMVYPDQTASTSRLNPQPSVPLGTCIIPNSISIVKNGLHASNAGKLVEFLHSRKTEEKLAFGPSHQMPMLWEHSPLPEGMRPLSQIRTMDVNPASVADALPGAVELLQRLFTR
jgi:iron(III) transport system substrate-binding protein